VPDAPDYISADELLAALNITSPDRASLAQSAVSAASRAIDQVCDRRFYADDDADQVRKFVPRNPGYAEIDDLCEFTSLNAQDSDWVLDQDFYFKPINAAADGEPWTSIITIARPFLFTASEVASGWAGFDGRITVTGKWGWAATPPQITTAATIIAEKIFKRMTDASFPILNIMDTAVRIGSSDAEVALMLEPFKKQLWLGW